MQSSTAETFLEFARQRRQEVELALEAYLKLEAGFPQRLQAAMAHSLLAPGKRLRPLLVLMSAQACGYDFQRDKLQAAMPAACAVEMIHTYSLIHDDLPAMDDDDMRRGRPTCHKAFDEATAILAGDALLALAFEVLARGIEPPEVAARCVAELARAAGPTALVGGQSDDLAAEFAPPDLDFLHAIHARKTGAMFNVSLRLGAIVAQASETELAAVTEYGRKLGLAFQVTDDLLDLQGSEASLGKRAGKDADRGKMTFPRLLGAEESRRYAAQLISDACRALEPLGERANELESLARYVLERNH